MNWLDARILDWRKKNRAISDDKGELSMANHLGMSLSLYRRICRTPPAYVLGLDEVGLGAYAGPLVVGAVLAPIDWSHPSLIDSKAAEGSTTENKEIHRREILKSLGTAPGARYFLRRTTHEAIDAMGGVRSALRSSFHSLIEGVAGRRQDVLIVIDGNEHLEGVDHIALPRADGFVPQCMAASLVAKVSRDTEMILAAREYPQYGFERHKGYGTKTHETALLKHGPCPIHRRTVKPVRSACTT